MSEDQQNRPTPETPEETTATTATETETIADVPEAQLPEPPEAADTSTEVIHPEESLGDGLAEDAEVPTKEEGIPEAGAAAEPEAETAEPVADATEPEATAEADEDQTIVEKAVETVKEAAEAVAETVSEAAASVADAVTGEDDDAPEAEAADADEGSILETSVAQAVEEMEVPQADADLLEETAPMTSIEDASALDQGESVGFTGEIVGKVVKLEDLQESLDEDENRVEYDQLKALIEETLTDVTEHEIVAGRVVSVGDKDVVIDIGFKSDGVVSKNEFDGELQPGDEVEVYLERIEDYHGQLVLSKTKADKYRRWERIENAFENEEVLEGTIVRRIKGGMIVELLDGLEAFLPGSQIDVRPVRDFDAYLEKRMEFKIVKINPANENVVVSHKALIEKELEAQREQILSEMEPGQILEGTVKNITDFGVFIDLGGVDGLLHITDLSWGRVSHPSELVDLDEKMKVVVLDYDKERQRISLGLKQLQPHPWDNIGEKFSEADVVEGKVVSITDYGAFVELEKGIEGLVHISEMSWTDHIRHPSQKVSLGQLVNVKILNIDHEGKKISLGMKQLEANPWDGLAERYPAGTVLRGKVRNITNFGVFVEIEPGIDGLVHISDLSWTKKVKHPGEIVKKGQELDVVILDVDEDRQRVSLGHKQIETNPWNDFANVYTEGTEHTATVQSIEDKGLVVSLGLDVEGFVPASELRHSDHFQSSYQTGQELTLQVLRFDLNQKEIILSETLKERNEQYSQRQAEQRQRREERQRETRAVKEYSKKATSGPTTLGELSGLEDLKAQMEAAEAEQAAAEAEAPEAEAPEAEAPEAEVAEPTEAEDTANVDAVADEATGEEPVATLDASESVAETEDFVEAVEEEKAATKDAVVEQAEEAADAETAEEPAEADAEETPEAEADAEAEADDEPTAEADAATEEEATEDEAKS